MSIASVLLIVLGIAFLVLAMWFFGFTDRLAGVLMVVSMTAGFGLLALGVAVR